MLRSTVFGVLRYSLCRSKYNGTCQQLFNSAKPIFCTPAQVVSLQSSFIEWYRSRNFCTDSDFGSNFRVAHPRQQRAYDIEKRKDNMTEEWDLVFSSFQHSFKLSFFHWLTLFGVFAGAFLSMYEYLDVEGDDDYMVLYVPMSAQNGIILAGILFYTLHFLIFRYIRRFPKNIYFNKSENTYRAVMRGFTPFSTYKVDFHAKDVLYTPNKYVRILKWNEYCYTIQKKKIFLMDYYFRTGADRKRMVMFSGVDF